MTAIPIPTDILTKVVKKRRSDTHKGNYGRVLLIGGSENYGGAIIMATEGALNSGAGLVAVATHSLNLSALHARDPEAMYIDWRDHDLATLIKKMDVVVCGPGLGLSAFAQDLMQLLCTNLTPKQTLILDASGLDLLAQCHDLTPQHVGKIILTPHQMEWQRLSQIKIPFQTDSANLNALNALFPQHNAILVLKSNHTHIYCADGTIYVNPLGNPGMATGGMGDTLAGIIGGFCAQFGDSLATTLASVYIHSLAGDRIAQTDYIVQPPKLSALLPQIMREAANKNC